MAFAGALAGGAGAALGSGIIGGLAGLFGGGHHGPTESDQVLGLYKQALQESLNLYKSTDYRKIDDAALKDYQASVEKESMAMLGNYDATAAAAGSPYASADTRKDRAHAQIAGDLAEQIGAKQLSLYTSEPARKAALLPNGGGATSLAPVVDQQNSLQQQGIIDSIMQITGGIDWKKILGSGHSVQNSTAGALDYGAAGVGGGSDPFGLGPGSRG